MADLIHHYGENGPSELPGETTTPLEVEIYDLKKIRRVVTALSLWATGWKVMGSKPSTAKVPLLGPVFICAEGPITHKQLNPKLMVITHIVALFVFM